MRQSMGSADPAAISVSQLSARVKRCLESDFADVWVRGEISDLARPRSGHVYLTLKDDAAQIRAVIWRMQASRLKVPLADGDEVLVHGRLDVYPPRGVYQLVVDAVEPVGEGALQRALRLLHARLAAEGLFDPALKRELPRFPRRIAVVTSPTGAAVRDFLEVLRQRWRGSQVLVVPTRVQGPGAAEEIAAAVERVDSLRPLPDVLVVTRGGGSLEDLWCFNEECVVRAIRQSAVPVVSAVGHEIDVTLADLAADVRALTPTEAGQRVVPEESEVLGLLELLGERLQRALRHRVEEARRRLDALADRPVLREPDRAVNELGRRLDELDGRLQRGWRTGREVAGQRIRALAARLEALSPLGVLARGYSLASDSQGRLLRDAQTLGVGDPVHVRLGRGAFDARVTGVVSELPAPVPPGTAGRVSPGS